MADRTGKGASASDLWREVKIRMDDRQAEYRRSWLRALPFLVLKLRRETCGPK